MENSGIRIYVLLLAGDHYYVGRTKHGDKRLESHVRGRGSAWTALYPVVKEVDFLENADKFDEDKYVLMYMDRHGIDNVRGGSYSQVVLEREQRAAIEHQLRSANDQCLLCGSAEHFAAQCSPVSRYGAEQGGKCMCDDIIKPPGYDSYTPSSLETLCDRCCNEFRARRSRIPRYNWVCHRCQRRKLHWDHDCNEKTTAYGKPLDMTTSAQAIQQRRQERREKGEFYISDYIKKRKTMEDPAAPQERATKKPRGDAAATSAPM